MSAEGRGRWAVSQKCKMILSKRTKGGSTSRVVSSMFLAQAKDTAGFEDGAGAPKVTINMPIFHTWTSCYHSHLLSS